MLRLPAAPRLPTARGTAHCLYRHPRTVVVPRWFGPVSCGLRATGRLRGRTHAHPPAAHHRFRYLCHALQRHRTLQVCVLRTLRLTRTRVAATPGPLTTHARSLPLPCLGLPTPADTAHLSWTDVAYVSFPPPTYWVGGRCRTTRLHSPADSDRFYLRFTDYAALRIAATLHTVRPYDGTHTHTCRLLIGAAFIACVTIPTTQLPGLCFHLTRLFAAHTGA